MNKKRKFHYEVTNIGNGIFLINEFFSTMFVICGSKRALVIDCGTGVGDFKSIVEGITKLPYDVVATHAHVDHIGGRGQFKDLYISEVDAKYVNKVNYVQRKGFVFVNSFLMGNNFSGLNIKKIEKEPIIHPVKNGDTFDLGGKTIKAVMTPGHTIGSMSLLDVEDRILFIGDVANEYILMWLPYATTIDEMIETQKFILSLDSYDTIWSSHHTVPTTREDVEKFIKGAQQVASRAKNTILPFVKSNNYHDAMLIYRTSNIHRK